MTSVITLQNLRWKLEFGSTLLRRSRGLFVGNFGPLHLGAHSGRIRCSSVFGAWRRLSLAFSSEGVFPPRRLWFGGCLFALSGAGLVSFSPGLRDHVNRFRVERYVVSLMPLYAWFCFTFP